MSKSIETHLLADDGLIPNSRLPLIVYREVISAAVLDRDAGAASEVIRRFARNGWGGAWVDGIYDFHHYHARSHEVLAVCKGCAEVQFGGPGGPTVRLTAGDGVVIPAGVGHCLKSQWSEFSVVGAYPAGQHDWDLKNATQVDRDLALAEIPNVSLPNADPFLGGTGTLLDAWS